MTDQSAPQFQSPVEPPPIEPSPIEQSEPVVGPPAGSPKWHQRSIPILTILKFLALGMLIVVFVIGLRYRKEALSAPAIVVEAVRKQVESIGNTLRGIPQPTPTLAPQPSQAPTSLCLQASWLTMEPGALMFRCQEGGQSDRVILGLEQDLQWISHAQFISGTLISYVECNRAPGAPNSGPYSCALVVHDLLTDQRERVVAYDSFPNSVQYHIGAEIGPFAWNAAGTTVAYLRPTSPSDPTSSATADVFEVHILDTQTGENRVLGSFPQPGGRGVGFDDETKVLFSPDESLVLTQMFSAVTWSENGQENRDEPILLSVFKVDQMATEPPVWQKIPSFLTFGSFESSDTVLVKNLSMGPNGDDRLARLNLRDDTMTDLGDATWWYGISALNPTTLLYWTSQNEQTMPAIVKFDIPTRSELARWENLTLKRVISPTLAWVDLYEPCPECEHMMGGFPGIKRRGAGLLNLQTGVVEQIGLQLHDTSIVFDVWLP